MMDEQTNECRQQLATIATARHQLAEVADWLVNHKDLEGYVPYPTPARSIALGIIGAVVTLKCAEAQLLSYILPGGIPQEGK